MDKKIWYRVAMIMGDTVVWGWGSFAWCGCAGGCQWHLKLHRTKPAVYGKTTLGVHIALGGALLSPLPFYADWHLWTPPVWHMGSTLWCNQGGVCTGSGSKSSPPAAWGCGCFAFNHRPRKALGAQTFIDHHHQTCFLSFFTSLAASENDILIV